MSTNSSSMVNNEGLSQRSRWGLVSTAAAVAAVVFGVYGGVNGVDDQQASTMPYLIGVVLAAAVIVFGLLLPRAMRAEANAARWSLGFAIVRAREAGLGGSRS